MRNVRAGFAGPDGEDQSSLLSRVEIYRRGFIFQSFMPLIRWRAADLLDFCPKIALSIFPGFSLEDPEALYLDVASALKQVSVRP
jgi:hypothetical protein